MHNVEACTDLEEAKFLWQRHWPKNCLFDLWPVRACFQAHFDRPPYFLVAKNGGRFSGMLALSWLPEEQYYGHFPGETWHGKTWLEQNRILSDSPEACRMLLESAPVNAEIRYLIPDTNLPTEPGIEEDETGFLFYPGQYGYSFESYMAMFSGKSRKKIHCELKRLEANAVTYRYDHPEDLDALFRMNLEGFQERSYFYDARFLRSFEDLADWLQANGLLRLTTVLIGGEIAAVDMGAVWEGAYTVLAGGTRTEFPGVAKLINLHHIEWACRQRLREVDFLCGNFNWKSRFHLAQRPLYELMTQQVEEVWENPKSCRSVAVA